MPKGVVLSDSKHLEAFSLLQATAIEGRLPHGKIKETADHFGVSRMTISRLWRVGGGPASTSLIKSPDVKRKSNRGGRPNKYNMDDLRAHVQSVPLCQRTCIQDLASKLKIPSSTLHCLLGGKDIRQGSKGFQRHTSSVKPMLTDANKLERVWWAVSKIDSDNGFYKSMDDEIHVDEKWFYMTKVNETYIMLDDEEDPNRKVKHKLHIDKVMFLAATAKPRWDPHQKKMWDGKIGIWPFAHQLAAQRSSANRPAGTLEWKTYNVNRIEYRKMMIEKVLPAIEEKWPRGTLANKKFIQQDNAPLHFKPDNGKWCAACQASCLDIKLVNQPPNSPDTNINDLAFFVSIQSLQHKIGAGSNKESLIQSVMEAYEKYDWKKLCNSWLTLQCCLNCIIEVNGNNDYKIVHMNKERLEREGQLPTTIRATQIADDWMEEE